MSGKNKVTKKRITYSGKNIIRLKSFAKVNLSLKIHSRLPDGYHKISTVMQRISLHDEINIHTLEEKDKIVIRCNDPNIPRDERNLAYKAVEEFKKHFDIPCGLRISINKRIPVGAGLGGGSSNAASVLVGLNKLFKTDISDKLLQNIGKNLGMDVPFFLSGSTALCYHKGEKIKMISSSPKLYYVLIYPGFEVSSKDAYTNLKTSEMENLLPDTTDNMIEAIDSADRDTVISLMINDLEIPVFKMYPKLQKIKDELILNGCRNAMMSGSGSTIYCVTKTLKEAKKIKDAISEKHDNVIVARTL